MSTYKAVFLCLPIQVCLDVFVDLLIYTMNKWFIFPALLMLFKRIRDA